MIGGDRDLSRHLHALGEQPLGTDTCTGCGSDRTDCIPDAVTGEPWCSDCIARGDS